VLYLVDGYNVTKGDPATRALSLEDQRTSLVRRLGASAGTLLGSGKVVVIFDGGGFPGSPQPGGPVKVVFSRTDENADDVIVRLATAERGAVTIVTDDLGIERRVRTHRGAALTRRLARSALYEAATAAKVRRSGRVPLGSLGMPPGGNAITRELKELWLTDDEE
jgi:predicted RNA-binding protein with PIN domain